MVPRIQWRSREDDEDATSLSAGSARSRSGCGLWDDDVDPLRCSSRPRSPAMACVIAPDTGGVDHASSIDPKLRLFQVEAVGLDAWTRPASRMRTLSRCSRAGLHGLRAVRASIIVCRASSTTACLAAQTGRPAGEGRGHLERGFATQMRMAGESAAEANRSYRSTPAPT